MICPAAYIEQEPEGQTYFCSGTTEKQLFQLLHGKFAVVLIVILGNDHLGNNLSSSDRSVSCIDTSKACACITFLLIRKCFKRNEVREH